MTGGSEGSKNLKLFHESLAGLFFLTFAHLPNMVFKTLNVRELGTRLMRRSSTFQTLLVSLTFTNLFVSGVLKI